MYQSFTKLYISETHGEFSARGKAAKEAVKELVMKLSNLIKLAAVSAFGLAAILGTNVMANAQDNRGYDQGQRQNISRRDNDRDRAENRRNTRGNDDRWRG